MFLPLHAWMTVNLITMVVSDLGCGNIKECRLPPDWIIRHGPCWHETPISSICYLYTAIDYDALAHLSPDITSLEICVDQFIANRLNLDHITELRELSFYPLRKNNASFFVVSSRATEHPFSSLQILEIHIHLFGIDTTLFKKMSQLKTLDLSGVSDLSADSINSVLEALKLATAPLEELYLHSSHNQISKGDILKVTDILMNLGGLPIKVLDVRGNTDLEFGGGFANFTPKLETLCFGRHRHFIMKDWDEKCMWLDISILPNLTFLQFELGSWPDFQQTTECSDPWADITQLSRISSHQKTLTNCSKFAVTKCAWIGCQCFAKIDNDQYLIDYATGLKYTQVSYAVFPPFPIGRNLEHLRISQTQMQMQGG